MVTLVSSRPSKELSEEDDYFDATFTTSGFERSNSFSGNFTSQIGMVEKWHVLTNHRLTPRIRMFIHYTLFIANILCLLLKILLFRMLCTHKKYFIFYGR